MPSELFNKGLVVRKEVLGEAYVEKSIKGADEFAGRELGQIFLALRCTR